MPRYSASQVGVDFAAADAGRPARFWVGLDVGEAKTNICVLGTEERPELECSCGASPAEIAECLAPFSREQIASVVMESGAAHSLTRQLGRLGYPTVLLDAGKVSRFLSIRQKTDGNDARGLAEIAKLERHAHLRAYTRDLDCQRIRDQLIVRQQLIRQRTATRNALRSMLRNLGSGVRQITSGKTMRTQVENELLSVAETAGPDTLDAVRSLLDLHEAQSRFIEQSDKRLVRLSSSIQVVQRFRQIPGVGPICAISFYSAIGDPFRFPNTASVGAYLGMVPRLKQSGMELRRSGITRAGDSMTRGHLVLSAGVMISRAAGRSAIKDWGVELVARKGYGRARVAVARKLATAMLSVWKSGEDFSPYPS